MAVRFDSQEPKDFHRYFKAQFFGKADLLRITNIVVVNLVFVHH